MFLAVLGDFIIKASLEALKAYQAREDIKQVEKDKAIIQHREFIIAYQDFMLRATLNPELYDQLRDSGQVVKFPSSADAGSKGSEGEVLGGDGERR